MSWFPADELGLVFNKPDIDVLRLEECFRLPDEIAKGYAPSTL